MRLLVIITLLIMFVVAPVFGMSDTSYEQFIKSREVVTTLYFQPNSESLTSAERKRVAESIDKLRDLQQNGRVIRVEGFSSPEGDQEKNFILSFFRARSVADLIEKKGLPAEVTLTGYGDLRAGSKKLEKERRVEIASYLKPAGMKRVKVASKKRSLRVTSAETLEQPEAIEQDIDSYRVDQAIRRKIEDKKGIADKLKELEEELAPGISQSKFFENIEDIERGYSLWRKSVDPDYSPKVSQVRITKDRRLQQGYSQAKKLPASDTPKLGRAQKTSGNELQQGFTQSEKLPASEAPKLGKAPKTRDNELQQGLTRWIESINSEKAPGVSSLSPASKISVDGDAPDVTMILPGERAPLIDALMIEQAIMEKLGVEPTTPTGSVTQVDQPDRNSQVQ